MVIRVGINGLGRIGRCVLRAIYESGYKDSLELAAINGSTDSSIHAHLIQYDSIHGKFNFNVGSEQNWISIENQKIPLFRERGDPKNIPWSKYGVNVVLECTGAFNKKDKAEQHLNSTVKKVIVSAPVADSDITIVYGVNNDMLKKEHKIISAGSCTTNCLGPVLKVVNDNLGVRNGFITTIHSYTNDQNIVDNNHKDIRRARACAMSIIPTTTGAAKTIGMIIPQLKGKIDGTAIRVPTPNVSIVDLTFNSIKPTDINEVNSIFRIAAKDSDIICINDEKLVSIDFIHNRYSAVIDTFETYVIDDTLCRVAAWYDNEWGFSHRMLDIVKLLSKHI